VQQAQPIGVSTLGYTGIEAIIGSIVERGDCSDLRQNGGQDVNLDDIPGRMLLELGS